MRSPVGAVFQTVLRNPLAAPYMLGVAGGSALGTVAAIALGVGGAGLVGAGLVGEAAVPLAAFAGGLGATAVVWVVARAGPPGGASMLLAGVVGNCIEGACITMIVALADPGRLESLVWWLLGYLDVPSWGQLGFVTTYVAAGVAVLLVDAPRMNLLALGDEAAASLGVVVGKLERRTFFACAAWWARS